MGTVAPNPYYTPEVADRCMKEIFVPTVEAMQKEGCPFKGCLYFGLMLTPDGPKVIEYNCRFGDPETQVVLPLLESDLLTVMLATTNGTLDETEVQFRDGAAACVILASGGYPLAYEKGKEDHRPGKRPAARRRCDGLPRRHGAAKRQARHGGRPRAGRDGHRRHPARCAGGRLCGQRRHPF